MSPDASPLHADASQVASAPDATMPGPNEGGAAEASFQDTTSPSPGDAADDGASEAQAGYDDAPGQADAPPPSPAVETCQTVWPQPDGVFLDTAAPDGVQMAIDATGNVYLALSYGGISYGGRPVQSAPPPALGVSGLPGYPLGLAIVKIDSACHLVWAREIGTHDVNAGFIQSVALGVDAASNVTIFGRFSGAIDFGDATVTADTDAGPALGSAFLMRLDATGALVFRDVFASSAGGLVGPLGTNPSTTLALAVSPAGVSTILVRALGDVVFGPPAPDDAGDANAPGGVYDAGWGAPEDFLVQVDTMGRVLRTLPPPSLTDGVLAGSDGTLWAEGEAAWDGGAGSVLLHLSGSAEPLFSEPAPGTLLAVGGHGAVFFDNGYQTTEELFAYSSAGTFLWSRPPSVYPIETADQSLAIDSNGNIIVGGLLQGTIETFADGSTTTIPSPAGIGYEVFDSTGALRSVRVFGDQDADVGSERFLALGVDPTNHVIIAGANQGTGGWNTTSLFVTKFAPSP